MVNQKHSHHYLIWSGLVPGSKRHLHMDDATIYISTPVSSLCYTLIYPTCLEGISILIFQKWSWFRPLLPSFLTMSSSSLFDKNILPKAEAQNLVVITATFLLVSHPPTSASHVISLSRNIHLSKLFLLYSATLFQTPSPPSRELRHNS